ncbi:condensation domain-containing protein, partial [Dyella tabacisoli]
AAREDHLGHKQLVGYAVPQDGYALDAAALRRTLAELLPDYMVPVTVVLLPALPLSPNGKLDRAALPAADFNREPLREPRNPQEAALAALFAEVLGIEQIGIDDSFFELGGDSIRSIQLVSRARLAGWLIKPRDVFQHKTVEALALVAVPAVDAATDALDIASGPLRATPIMQWFLEHGGAGIQTFHQNVLLRSPAELTLDSLIASLQVLLDHHDLLRLRLSRSANHPAGEMIVLPEGSVDAASCVARVDAHGMDSTALRQAIATHTDAAQQRLAPYDGKMLQAVWFDAGDGQQGRLLLLLHHLVVDGVSWRIVLPDLAGAWQALHAGRPAVRPAKSSSFRLWADKLAAEATSERRQAEWPLWKRMLEGADPQLAPHRLDPQLDRVQNSGQLQLRLPVAVTEALLGRVPSALNGRINDVLLTAFGLALADWRKQRGQAGPCVRIDLEGHGREDIFDGVDLSRTVGWFTSVFPISVELGDFDVPRALAGHADLGRAFKQFKEQLHALPDHGLGFGLLRHLNPTTAATLSAYADAQVSFNYLGRFEASDQQAWTMADEADRLGSGSDGAMPLTHAIALNALAEESVDGPCLVANWSWAARLFNHDDIADLAQGWFRALEALVTFAQSSQAGGFTPSDVPLLSINQADIEYLESLYASRH